MSAPLWAWEPLVAAAAGRSDGPPPSSVTGFSIDTRSLAPGEMFVALRDRRDGHDFVSAAFAAGAAAALVSQSYTRKPGDGALLRVDDPLKGLERIAIAARARLAPDARVVAVTGSAGKTGSKEMLRACLSVFGPTHAPDKSFNNHWGVPLTLARMPAATRFAVIEMGMNHAGEIAPLSRMARPHIAVITNVLPVHIGNFEDGETGVAQAKAEVFDGLEPGGIAVLPADNPHFPLLERKATARGARVIPFGTGPGAAVRASAIDAGPAGTSMTVDVLGRVVRVTLGAPGLHLAMNALAIAAVIALLGLNVDDGLAPLAAVSAPPGRGQRTELALAGGRFLLIDESYNANPASVAAALAAMATVPRDRFARRIAVLGDMLELGPAACDLHAGLKEPVDAAKVDLVFACGPHMKRLYDSLAPSRQGGYAASSAGLVDVVSAAVRPGDVVMVKGSLGTRMAPIVDALKAAAART